MKKKEEENKYYKMYLNKKREFIYIYIYTINRRSFIIIFISLSRTVNIVKNTVNFVVAVSESILLIKKKSKKKKKLESIVSYNLLLYIFFCSI